MSASTALDDVLKMLEKCAPGYKIRLANHSRVIHFGGKVFPSLPKHDPLEIGHIRKLVRFFALEPCAAKHLPGIIKDTTTKTEPKAESIPIPPPQKSFKKKK